MRGVPSIYDQEILEARKLRNLTRLIMYEIKNSNSTTIIGIYGRPGAGKSIYAMKVAYDIYRDWDAVLKYIVFTPFDFQEAVDFLEKRDSWIPLLIWDDAGPWLELLKRNSWHPLALGIRGLFETMRLRIGAVVLTMTSERSLPRSILYNGNIYKIRVRVWRNGHKDDKTPKSIAEIQVRKEKMSEWGSYYWDTNTIYIDHITLTTPNYHEYEVLRKQYISIYMKLVEASRTVGPGQLLDYVYKEWKKMKEETPRRGFYEQ